MCLQRLITTYCNSAGQKERNKRGGGESHLSVTLPQDDEEKKNRPNEENGRQQEQTKRGSRAVHFPYSEEATARNGVRSVSTFFFILSLPSFFFFLENTPKRHARDNNCVSFTTGYINTFQKPAFAQAKQQIQKERKNILPPPRGKRGQWLSLHKHAQCFSHAPTGKTSVAESKRNSCSDNVGYSKMPPCAA